MKYLHKFNESKNTWGDIIEFLDVYQLYELLVFTYGDTFPYTKESIEEEEGDYNPDHIYDIIKYELESTGRYDDFISNFDEYKDKMDESDPTHWKNRKKSFDDLTKGWEEW